jgi:ElaB/YqjD/DUF883 family membrane-anchored ribosome-binding protein
MANPSNLASNRTQALDEGVDMSTATAQDGGLVTSETYENDMAKLQEELSALRSTVTTLLGEVRTGAAKTLRAAGDVVTHQSSALATTASDHAHNWASELESLARRKPLSTIAGALVAGVIIGLLGRRRS